MTNGEIILKLIKDVGGIELELGDEFNVNYSFLDINYNLLKVTQKGLIYVYDGQDCNISLQGFIKAIKTIKVKPKFPPTGTRYYYVTIDNNINYLEFDEKISIDVLNYKIGNFFLTYEKAKQNKSVRGDTRRLATLHKAHQPPPTPASSAVGRL